MQHTPMVETLTAREPWSTHTAAMRLTSSTFYGYWQVRGVTDGDALGASASFCATPGTQLRDRHLASYQTYKYGPLAQLARAADS
jgi:hypothetical protein